MKRVEPEVVVAVQAELESAAKVEEEIAPFETPFRKHRKKSKGSVET